ncbi:MAG: ABC transporter permease [Pseudomonadota bacterium]
MGGAVTGLPMLGFIAWRNLWRNPIRSLLTISALAGGLVMVILYATLLEGMTRQMVASATEVNTGHLQLHRQGFIDDRDLYATLPDSWLERLAETLPEGSVAPRLYAAALASSGEHAAGAMLKAIDPQREPKVTKLLGHVRHGKVDLGVAGHTPSGVPRHNVLVGAKMARNMQLQPGSELILVTQAVDGSIGNGLFRVAAILRPIEPGFDRSGVLMSIDAFRELLYLQQGYHELAIRLDDAEPLSTVQGRLQERVAAWWQADPADELGGEPVLRSWRQLTPAVADLLALSETMLLVIGLIIIGLASLGMLNTMLMAVHERTHEFGILLAIGMKRRWLLGMVLLESLLLALVAALLGSLLGTLLSLYLQRHGIDFSAAMPDGYDWAGIVFEPVIRGHFEPQQLLTPCLLMLAVTLVASLIPSWRTVRLKPAEVMR